MPTLPREFPPEFQNSRNSYFSIDCKCYHREHVPWKELFLISYWSILKGSLDETFGNNVRECKLY